MLDGNHIFGVNKLGILNMQLQLLNDILNKYGEVFENKSGALKDTLVHITIKKMQSQDFIKLDRFRMR